MYFRFGFAVILIVVVSIAGIALEKRSLELRRDVSHQQYQLDVMRDELSESQFHAQQLGAPTRMLDHVEAEQPRYAVRDKSARVADERSRFQLSREDNVRDNRSR